MRLTKCISGVRPFVAEDIPAVTALHRNVFGGDPETRSEYEAYFRTAYLENPSRDGIVEPLVCEENGEIVGFLGSVVRRMIWQGEPIVAALGTNFAVSEKSRGMAGVKLLGAFLAGRQDLSISDVVASSARKLWEGLGGSTSLLHSVRWVLLLLPTRAALDVVRKRPRFSAVARLLDPAARALDALAQRFPKSPFRRRESSLVADPLNCSDMLSHAGRLTRSFSLRVNYDEASLLWMLRRADEMNATGNLQKVLLRTAQGQIVGWYLYYANSGGIGDVLQITAEDCWLAEAFDHLCAHALSRGVVGLTGRLERGLLEPLSRRVCVFDRQQSWVLVHSRHQPLVDTFQRGDAFFSRLEGEWCMRFKG